MRGIGEVFDAFAVGEGGRVATAEDHRRDGQIDFINDASAEQGFIERTAALAKEAFDVPFFTKPTKCFDEIDLIASANLYLIGKSLKLAEVAGRDSFTDQDNDG